MKAKFLGLAASLVMFGAIPSQASTLVDHVTYTTDTGSGGLEWLDVSLTTNISYDTMVTNLANPLYAYYGYRFATASEVATLFAHAEITDQYNGPTNAELSAVATLMGLLGYVDESSEHVTVGYTQYEAVAGTNVAALIWCYGIYNNCQVSDSTWQLNSQSKPFSDLGSFLVRAPAATPLPAAFPLFVTGLGALGLLGWRRKRKNAAAIAAA